MLRLGSACDWGKRPGMKLRSSRWLSGSVCLLLASAVAAACGSDSKHIAARAGEGGQGGQGGQGVARGGEGATPPPQAGSGGEVSELGGEGGELSGGAGAGGANQAGQSQQGGVPATGGTPAGGAGGSPDVLPVIDCDPIVFADANLESAVRDAIAKPTGPLTSADVAGLLTLDAQGPVAFLSGIECLTDLETADFGPSSNGEYNFIGNLASLRYLTQLVTLNLGGNFAVGDLAPLGELPNLEVLSLAIAGNDLSPLATAPSLRQLFIISFGSSVGDLTPLGQIATLEGLHLDRVQLTEPATLSALTNIKSLDLHDPYYAGAPVPLDAAVLAPLTQLVDLNISDQTVTNFDQLAPLVNLTSLRASLTGITSASAVQNMTKLVTLDLSYTQVADVTPLSGLTLLQELDLSSAQVADLTPLSGLTLLQNLNLNFDGGVTNITPLVNNAGLGAGDTIGLYGTSLNCTSEGPKVATLIGRGATVSSPCN
jgi:Leucine-rich repeat (LRR) protein